MKTLGIYIHIPFCVRKCNYCDFVSMASDDELKDRYVKALCREIKGYGDKYMCADTEYEVKTVYIGGGTPSIIAPFYIEKILKEVKEVFTLSSRVETTIEVNPGTVTKEKLDAYKRYGINRLSIGLQSANDDELKELGRIHDLSAFAKTYKDAVAAGFENINVDIMLAIPGQTQASLINTLDTVTGLKPRPTHISAYSLILEEGTPFYEKYAAGKGEDDCLFSEDEERAMYHNTVKYLADKGYKRYEISNFSLERMESRHNTSYWKRTDYLGFGLSASSLINDVRYKNTVDIEKYINAPCSKALFAENYKLVREDKMSEFMFLGLRMSEGVDRGEFFEQFGIAIEDVYGHELDRFIKEGLLRHTGTSYALTDRGIDYGNYVFSGFVD